MILDILVPQYKETEEVIKPLLDSISMQRGVDFKTIGVIIVNDGTDVILSDDFLNSYKFKITYIKNEHKGVSETRNEALRHSTADYVMWCDADDMFYHVLAIQTIIQEILTKKPIAIVSDFIEEKLHNNVLYYVMRQRAFVFVHGKIYKRQFLLDNNIWWDPELTVHEDGYFNGLALSLIPGNQLVYIQNPLYMWLNNPNSVSRYDPYYVAHTYKGNMKAQDKLLERLFPLNEAGASDLLNVQLCQTFFFLTGKYTCVPELAEEMAYVDDITTKFIKKYYKYFEKRDRNKIKEVYEAARNGAAGFRDDNKTIEDFYQWYEMKKRK